MAKDIVICRGARTGFGEFGGGLKDISAIDLGVVAAKGALEKTGVAPDKIDHVVFGNAMQTSSDALYGARHVGLKCGIPQEVPALTVNRICGSGLQAVVTAAEYILLGEAKIVLAGGMENMSQAPHVIRGARWGLRLGEAPMEDSLWAALLDTYCQKNMAITAETLAEQYGITRQEQDEYAYRSFTAAQHAASEGRLAEEIVPVEIPQRKGDPLQFVADEHIRETSLDRLTKLRPVFKKDGGVTAGNASGINDGAAALIVASRERAAELGLPILARMVATGVCGVDPNIMGIGPVAAITKALERAGLSIDEMDLIEINEAFAAQYLACEKALKIPREKANVNGGAIAIGHPLGASGARLALTLVRELNRRELRYGVASLCIGGGQGIAVIFERVS